MKCPKCGREFDRLLALSRDDNKTMICDDCGTAEALRDFGVHVHQNRRLNHYERTKAQVYATGNKWAIENFEATHN